MNRKTFFGWLAILVGFVGTNPAVMAQAPGMPGGDTGFNSLVTKLFRQIPTFSAAVDTTMTNKADRSRVMTPMKMAKLESVLRIEVDLLKVRGAGLSLQGMTALQNIGMSRMVSLMHKGSNHMVLLFPELKFHTRVALPDSELMDERVEVIKKPGGRDLINGYTCTRQDVTVKIPGGVTTELVAWEAKDLRGFPVRMFFQDEKAAVVMNYRDVKLTPPPAEQFEIPPGWRYFDTLQELMQAATAEAMRNIPSVR